AFALHRRLAFTSVIQREVRSRTTRPYIRTISSARTRPSRTVRCGVRMWCTTARSLPRSTISPTSNSSSAAASTSCGTVRFPLFTLNFTRTWSTRFAHTVFASLAWTPATRRPPESIAVMAIRVSPRSAQGSPPLRTAGGSDEPVDPGVAGFRQVGPFRFIEEAAQIRGRGEIPQPENGYESTAAARQRQPHGQRTRTESEQERARMGLPCDSGRAEGAQYHFHDQEENDNLEGRQGWHPQDREKQGHTVPREQSAVRAERREDPRGRPDQEDRSCKMDEDKDERPERAA